MVKAIVSDTPAKRKGWRWSFFNEFIDPGLIERLSALLQKDFARITYTEAIEHLKKGGYVSLSIPWNGAAICRPSMKKYLTEQVFKRRGVCDRLPQRNQILLYAPE